MQQGISGKTSACDHICDTGFSASTFPVSEIKAGDYIEIEKGFGPGSCDCCGYKWVNFQERISYERMNEPPRMNRKICKKCYEIAKRAESSQFRVLPGVLNPGMMTRVSKDLGRCQVWVCSVSGRRPRAMESCHKEQ